MHPHGIRLRPAPHTRTPIEAYSLKIEPAGHFVDWQQDAFGNFLARVVFPERARKLSITVGLVADMEVINPFDFFIEDYAEYFGWEYPPELAADLEPYRGRYVVTCNGVPVPLLGTGKDDVQVAGVRYRAWQPPSALHPTIEVHSPLVFDVVDLESGRSRGGCTYHVVHPGGRAYDTPPVNAVEAQSRRNRRFEDHGFTPGRIDLARLQETQARLAVDVTAPGLLDLRRTDTAWR